MSEAVVYLLAVLVVGGVGIYLVQRLFGQSGGSVKADFDAQVKKASDLQADIDRLQKESTRDTANFEEALRKHRARFGGSSTDSNSNGK